ncbi:40S ribosomal protein [Dirofilaria immitis]
MSHEEFSAGCVILSNNLFKELWTILIVMFPNHATVSKNAAKNKLHSLPDLMWKLFGISISVDFTICFLSVMHLSSGSKIVLKELIDILQFEPRAYVVVLRIFYI